MMKKLTLPLNEAEVRGLALEDSVLLTGTIFTARDAAHKYLSGTPDASRLPDLTNAVLYHCGPVIVGGPGTWRVTAAGPTTSIREEPYMADIIRRYGVKAIIGKGGMGAATAEACRQFGCVYLAPVGGAAQVLASAVAAIPAVYMLEEFGAPEALWQLDVVDFPAIVTMDAAGNSLYAQVKARSDQRLAQLLEHC